MKSRLKLVSLFALIALSSVFGIYLASCGPIEPPHETSVAPTPVLVPTSNEIFRCESDWFYYSGCPLVTQVGEQHTTCPNTITRTGTVTRYYYAQNAGSFGCDGSSCVSYSYRCCNGSITCLSGNCSGFSCN